MKKIKLLAISGSLRKASYNTAVLNTLAEISPEHIEIMIADISELPLFNPDRETESIPALENIKAALKHASGLIISSPEYAHGISGPMKNALDWLVSGSEFVDLPIMLINTSPRAQHALDALKEVLITMSGVIVDKASVAIPLLGTVLNTKCDKTSNELVYIAENEVHYEMLTNALNAFYDEISNHGVDVT
ncbi:NADPH-dependent FMN reductase [Psychromonas algicola]|uniref:NADPH-dependent FMN reductase n=1 Tax=Psychromonas algicola TaxID=2555642 RepID=UPI0010677F35|nr:NADPH-dependent FMN reductase [Psychromonas sp. RZ5]TEW49828.1 NAD(P)H-dependent oxidoreductase [Psychromonas sp. RZ5]